jgi:hypothetical protein
VRFTTRSSLSSSRDPRLCGQRAATSRHVRIAVAVLRRAVTPTAAAVTPTPTRSTSPILGLLPSISGKSQT